MRAVVGGHRGAGQVDDGLAVGHGHHERAARHGGDVVMHHAAARLDHAHVEVLLAHGGPPVDHHGIGFCEHPTDEELPETAGEFVRVRDYRYGKILLTAYRHQSMV